MNNYFICEDDLGEIQKISPELLIVLSNVVNYCFRFKLRCCITSIIRCQDSFSKSDTHQTGRAFDLSIKEWSNSDIEDFMIFITQKCNEFAATDIKGEKRLVIHHDIGLGDHLHIQVRRVHGI